MASTAELSNSPKEPEAKRQDNASSPAAPQQVQEPDSSPLNHALGGAPGEQPTHTATRILNNPALAHLANKGTRAVALMRAQQTRGNRYTQGVVANMQRKPESGADVKQPTGPGAKDPGDAASASPGQPLNEDVRRWMAAHLGADFRDVRIHSDAKAAASAKALHADAYTEGRDIYFAAGKYAPYTREGRRLLAHELVHTIHQTNAAPPAGAGGKGVADDKGDDWWEKEADRAADEFDKEKEADDASHSQSGVDSSGAHAGEKKKTASPQPKIVPQKPVAPKKPADDKQPHAQGDEGGATKETHDHKANGAAVKSLTPPAGKKLRTPDLAAPAAPHATKAKPSSRPVAKSPAGKGGGAAAPGAGGGRDPVQAWKGNAKGAVGGIKPKQVTGGQGHKLQDAASKTATSQAEETKKLPADGAAAVTPPKDNKDLPAIPNDTSAAAIKLVTDKLGRKLKDVTLPPLENSPLGHTPEIGKAPKTVSRAPAKAEGADKGAATTASPAKSAEGGKPDAQKKIDQVQKKQEDKPPPVKKVPAAGVSIKDEPVPAVSVPEAIKVDVGDVVATLLAEPQKQAQKIVDDARNSAFRGALKKKESDFGKGLVKDEQPLVEAELHRVADAAGVVEKDLKKKVEDRQKELEKSKEESDKDLKTSMASAKTETEAANASYLDVLRGTHESLDRAAQDRAAAAKGEVDFEKVRKECERLIGIVNDKAGMGIVEYESAAKRFKESLDAEMNKQIRAYEAAAQEDQEQLNDGADTPEKKEAAREAYRKTKYWVDKRIADLRRDVEIKGVQVNEQIEVFKKELNAAATEARDKIRDWSAKRMGYERSFLQRIFDWISDWLGQAKVESDAWAKKRTEENKATIDKNTLFLNEELAKLQTMTEEERKQEIAKLSEEQVAVIQGFFSGGGETAEERTILGVAAGLIAHISVQRRPDLLKKIEQEVLACKDFDKVNAVAMGEDPSFKAEEKSDRLHDAFAGPGTTEADVFKALGGLTAVQAHAVELSYEKDWKEPLKQRLDSELNDWATWSSHDIDRANAMLAGDSGKATAIELDQAMHGNWNGLDLGGTDEDAIFAALRNKSPSEVAAIKAAYKEKYNKELEGELVGELDHSFVAGTHDVDRMKALLASDVITADTIALDQAMHGGWLGLGIGTDRDTIEKTYTQLDQELEQEAQAKGWDSKKLKEEKSKRRKDIEGVYETKYGASYKDPKGKKSALTVAYEDDMEGDELNLITGIHEQNLAKSEAARIHIEHKGTFYADDKIINKALLEQYTQDYKDNQRDLYLKLDEEIAADREADRKSSFKKWTPEAIRERRKQLDALAEGLAKQSAQGKFDDLEKEYNTQYKSDETSKGLRKDVMKDTQGSQNDRASKIMEQKGYVTQSQEITYAIQGAGTDSEKVSEVMKGKNKKEMDAFGKQWEKENPGKGKFVDWIKDDFSGREYADNLDLVMFGEAETPEEKLAKAKRQLAFEKKSSNSLASRELQVLQERVYKLEKEVKDYEDFAQAKEWDPNFDWEKYSELQGKVDRQASIVDSSITSHRKEVDVITDTAAQVIGAVVTVVIIAVSIIADVLTVGGAAAATPAEGAAIAAVWSALGVSLAGSALTMLTKAILKGDAYGWEESSTDLVIALVDAITSVATAGMGGKLIKGSATLAAISTKGAIGKAVVKAVGHAVEGAVSATPGALLGNTLNPENYKGGNIILNILEGTAVQVGGAAAMSAGVGSLTDSFHGLVERSVIEPELIKARVDPDARAKIFEKYQARNPGKTYEDFLTNLDHVIIGRTQNGFNDPQLQESMRAQLLEHVPHEQKATLSKASIEVMSEDEFKAFTRSESGRAVTIIRDGKPVVILRAGTDFSELGAEGIHLLQAKDKATAAKVRKLDEAALKDWDHLDIDTQLDLYRTKVELEIDAHEQLIKSLEAKQADAPNAATAKQLEKAETNLKNLRKRLGEVDVITPKQREQITLGVLDKPPYLDQPPRLFSKDPKLALEPALPTIKEERKSVRAARDELAALKAAEKKGPITVEQKGRIATLEAEIDQRYAARKDESLKQMEDRLFDQRAGESLADYRERLKAMREEVERGAIMSDNIPIYERYEKLLVEVDSDIVEAAGIREEIAKARAHLKEASDSWDLQRRAMKDPSIKIPKDAPLYGTKAVNDLLDRVMDLERALRSVETRGSARSKTYEFKDLGVIDPCFAPGTLVATPGGTRPIESLESGDLVLAFDISSREVIAKPILKPHHNWTEFFVHIQIGAETILATREHPFWVEGKDWQPAKSLQSGDALRGIEGTVVIDSVEVRTTLSPTINLEVAELHNFFVGATGVLVHNGKKMPGFDSLVPIDTRIYRIIEVLDDGSERTIYVGKTYQGMGDDVETRFKKHLKDKPDWREIHEKPKLPGDDRPRLRTERIARGNWTPFETAVWERHLILKYKALGSELENSGNPLKEETFDLLKKQGRFNGC